MIVLTIAFILFIYKNKRSKYWFFVPNFKLFLLLHKDIYNKYHANAFLAG